MEKCRRSNNRVKGSSRLPVKCYSLKLLFRTILWMYANNIFPLLIALKVVQAGLTENAQKEAMHSSTLNLVCIHRILGTCYACPSSYLFRLFQWERFKNNFQRLKRGTNVWKNGDKCSLIKLLMLFAHPTAITINSHQIARIQWVQLHIWIEDDNSIQNYLQSNSRYADAALKYISCSTHNKLSRIYVAFITPVKRYVTSKSCINISHSNLICISHLPLSLFTHHLQVQCY